MPLLLSIESYLLFTYDFQDLHICICLIILPFVLFLLQVTFGGPGQQAGLHVGDVVLEVNGQNVAGKYLEDVMVLMKDGGNFLSLRVTEQTGNAKRQENTRPTHKVNKTMIAVFMIHLQL